MPRKFVCYAIVRNDTAHGYVGRTLHTLRVRLQKHFSGFGNAPLGAAAACGKYTFAVHSWRCDTEEEMVRQEQNLINLLGGPNAGWLYNLKDGGDECVRYSAASRKKMSEAARRKFADPAMRAKYKAGARRRAATPGDSERRRAAKLRSLGKAA